MNDQNGSERQINIGGRQIRLRMPPRKQGGGAGLGGLIHFILMVAALIDLRRRPAEQINGSKRLWVFLVSLIYLIGPIGYFVFGRKRVVSDASQKEIARVADGV
jgi:hypothetical protein